MKRQLRWVLGAGTALAGVSFALPHAIAQETQADGNREVVVVTARRREESIIDAPVAVTAVSDEQLEVAGAIDITSVQKFTPNATIEVARGSNSTLVAFIRGVGQQDPVWGFEPGVGVYVDDVFIARPQGAVLDIFDVERVEVLRGPQGTLYGRNTIGGAIKYVTKGLNMNAPEAKLRVNAGSYNQLDMIVSGSAPLSDTFAVGGALARYTRDGFGTNLNTGADHYNKDILAGRVSAEWQPSDTVRIKFAADMTEDNSNAKHGHRLLPSGDGTIPVTRNVYDTRAGLGTVNSVETKGASLTAEWDMNDNVTFKSITAYREGETVTPIDFDALPQADLDVPAWYNDDQFSQEFQALFDYGAWSGVAGLYYLDGSASGAFDLILSSLGLTIFQGGLQEKQNFSAFADVTYEFNDQWSVSLGGRWTDDETTADVTREVWLGQGSASLDPSNTTSVFFATQTGYTGLNRTDDQFTPRISVNYEPTDDMTIYASYSQGFKAGGFDPRAREDLDPLGLSRTGFAPEVVDSYEIGIKGSYFDGVLDLNTAIFLADYKDQQIQVQEGADADGDGVNDTFISSVFNAGKSQYQGVEIEGVLYAHDNLFFSGMLGYIDAEIEEIISGGTNVANLFVTQNTPEWSGRFGMNYIYDFANGADLNFNVSASYRDEYYLGNAAVPGFAPGTNTVFPDGAPPLDPEAYTLLDMSLIYTSPTGRWRAGLHGRNLTEEEYRIAGYNFVTPSLLGADGAYSAFYGPPRTFTASLEFVY